MARTPTDIEKVRGDQKRYRLLVTEESTGVAPTTPFSGNVVARMTVKRRLNDPLSAALIALATYDSSELLVADAANWEFLATIKSGTDSQYPPGTYCWDFETIRAEGTLKTSPGDGTVTITAGSGLLEFTDLTVPEVASIGDILNIQGLDVAVIDVPANPNTNLQPNQLQTDYLGFTAGAGQTFTLFQGNVKSPDRLFGEFTLLADVTN
jgi:hypothetical protein